MHFVPAVVAVGDVGSGDSDSIADMGNRDLWMKIHAGGVGVGLGVGWRVVTDYLYHEFTVGMRHVDQIQNRFVLGVKSDVQIAIRRSVHRRYATLDGRTRLNYRQPVLFVDVLPQVGVAAFSLQFHRHPSWIAKSCHQK